jgi:hypothetical protein
MESSGRWESSGRQEWEFDKSQHLSKIIDALKAVILTALREGYSKESYLVKNHVSYIRKIESANNPEGYIRYTAKKLLPEKESYAENIMGIQAKYTANPDLASRIIKVYDLYNNIPREALPRCKITEDAAEKILAQLLNNLP